MLATIRDRLAPVDRLTYFRGAVAIGLCANPALIDRDPNELATWTDELATALADQGSDERPGR